MMWYFVISHGSYFLPFNFADIVFCRTWVPVEPKKFCNIITSMLAPPDRAVQKKSELQAESAQKKEEEESNDKLDNILDEKAIEQRANTAGASAGYQQDGMVLMKPQRVLRKIYAQPVEQHPDSQYRPIERPVRRFNPLKIPKNVQANLPFKDKPKQQKPKRRETYEQKRYVEYLSCFIAVTMSLTNLNATSDPSQSRGKRTRREKARCFHAANPNVEKHEIKEGKRSSKATARKVPEKA